MEFALDEFMGSPSLKKIEKCRKADLLILANCYNVHVAYSARKAEIKHLLCAKLVEQGILPNPAADVAEGVAGDEASDAPMAELKAAEAASMLAAGVKLGPVTDPVMGNLTTEDLRLALQIKEVETKNKQLEVQAMHLRIRALELEREAPVASTRKHIALVPPFRESEVDSYFSAFERIAAALSWPKEFWSLLLQCKLIGKAQEVCASLSIEDSLDYNILKKTVLQAYELVPEAYRQKFRNSEKAANQTYVEFVRDKSVLFDKWCQACNVKSMVEMRELILVEEFKKCSPERIVVYLNEQKETSVAKAAVLADEFILTHKSVFSVPSPRVLPERKKRSPKLSRKSTLPAAGESRECFYCHEPGHLIALCPVLRRKGQQKNAKPPVGVGFINTASPPEKRPEPLPSSEVHDDIDLRFKPFVSAGFVSVTEKSDKVAVTILRDTAAYRSFILTSVLPLSSHLNTSCGSDLLVWGIKMCELNAPLHMIHLQSPLVSGHVKVAVLPRFPISGISFILGNDLAGGNVFPLPEVITDPSSVASAGCPTSVSSAVPKLFPVCAVTRAQARKLGDSVDLCESFMATLGEGEPSFSVSPATECDKVATCVNESELFLADPDLSLNLTREMLINAQKKDLSLTLCLSSAVAAEEDGNPGSSLQSRFSGPYTVDRKISDTDYVVHTPDRKRKSRVCHINMLKRYFSRMSELPQTPAAPVMSVSMVPTQYNLADDGLAEKSGLMPAARLRNSEVLGELENFLSHLSASARADITELIEDNLLLFSDHPSQTSVLYHDVDVGSHKPIKQHAYRVNPTKRALMQQEVNYLVEHGLAVPSTSAWSSPCVLVPKPDSTPRFCNDYRKVNSVTKPDSFPLPRMEDCIDRVGSAQYVTKLDLLKGYWQVPLTHRASEISAFVTPDTFLQYTVMPFGLRNAPATFQRLMHLVLSGVENCEAYLDDVVAYSSTWSDHLNTLSLIFRRLHEASLMLNLAKCEFGKATVTYLGKQVGQGQVRPLAEKVQTIIDFPPPQSKKALRRFLGMCGYYRGFCRNFSDVVAPLTGLVSPLKTFLWSPACQAAFESAKALLCSAPVLAVPCFARPFKLEVDASACGAGAVLLQEDEQAIDHPVCYFSRKFNKHQLNYSTIEKEALALLLALQYFEVYTGSSSQPVLVYTDHNPLTFLANMRNSNQRLMRWSLLLQDFNLQIQHKKGTENIIADALSRCSSEP
ncbi:Retrovirus-related Pol polyprotein from transposon 297 [Merluccius polli]|uniref:ribonuclease H n=1 Tax=Merluccius polli TaxID=89951 RepID=A0AA47P1Z8_MERPO|nr:Retrovirus-related Pol polyprotein from transposon 297 [Merluccius polli]